MNVKRTRKDNYLKDVDLGGYLEGNYSLVHISHTLVTDINPLGWETEVHDPQGPLQQGASVICDPGQGTSLLNWSGGGHQETAPLKGTVSSLLSFLPLTFTATVEK